MGSEGVFSRLGFLLVMQFICSCHLEKTGRIPKDFWDSAGSMRGKRQPPQVSKKLDYLVLRIPENTTMSFERSFSFDNHEQRIYREAIEAPGVIEFNCWLYNTCPSNSIMVSVKDKNNNYLSRQYFRNFGWNDFTGTESRYLKFEITVKNCYHFIPYKCTIKSLNTRPKDCGCGKVNSLSVSPSLSQRIYGGSQVTLGTLPWVVKLEVYSTPKKYSLCAGSIISKNFILTAAHCFDQSMGNDQIYITVGSVQSRQVMKDVIKVKRIHIHTNYSDDDNDLALVQVTPIKFRPHVKYICLPFGHRGDDWVGKTASVSGWGKTKKQKNSPILLEAHVKIMGREACQKQFKDREIVSENMLCASSPGRDACEGDSGGSLALKENGHYTLVGVVSWGIGCASSYPGVYMDVTRYLDWIVKTTGNKFCEADNE